MVCDMSSASEHVLTFWSQSRFKGTKPLVDQVVEQSLLAQGFKFPHPPSLIWGLKAVDGSTLYRLKSLMGIVQFSHDFEFVL